MKDDIRKDEVTAPEVALVKFRDREFTIPRDQADWSLDLLEALEDDRGIGALRAALGPAQWAQIKAMKLKSGDVEELTSAVVEALGFKSTGESPASSA